uniref:uncharacterized protein n=1 Tax=Pristiophorus japonicus TaxID=55135 RepID=UPI00398F80E6
MIAYSNCCKVKCERSGAADVGKAVECALFHLLNYKKPAGNRVQLCKTGGGLSKTIPLTDLKERAAALTGASDRTATCVGAEPVLPEVAQVEPPTPPREESLQGRTNEEMVVEETVEMMLEELEDNTSQSVVMLVLHEEGEVAGLQGSFLPKATGSLAESNFLGFQSKEAVPSGLQWHTPIPVVNPRKLIRQSGNVARQADTSLDMVGLSTMSIDLIRELIQAIAGLSENIAALAARQSEDLAELIAAVRENTRTTNANALLVHGVLVPTWAEPGLLLMGKEEGVRAKGQGVMGRKGIGKGGRS